MSDNRDVVGAAMFFGLGIWSFFGGFKSLRRKRKIENIPTSTIRGLAMGLVEVIGKTKKISDIRGPITATECVFYRYTVERYQRSGKSSRWVKIAEGDSSASPFWLDDSTGRIMVLPFRAELILPVDYQFTTRIGRSLPDNLVRFMQENHLSYRSLFADHPLRFKEWHICEDERIYVLGTASAVRGDNYLNNYREKLFRRLEEFKGNTQEMSKVDLNKDGEISLEEWDLAVAKIEEELLEKELNSVALDNQFDAVISKGDLDKLFIISDYSQADLVKRLSWLSFAGVFGGSALALAMLAYLLFRLKYIFRF